MNTIPDGCSSFPFAPNDKSNDEEKDLYQEPETHLEAASLFEIESTALRSLKEALSNVPHEEKSALVHVQRTASHLVSDDHLLSFLRTENFDVDLALTRILRYWEHRYKVFGPDRYALPMTLHGAMKNRTWALKKGFLSLLPVLDEAGRAILYSNSTPYKESMPESEEKIQVWWYLIHVAMENPEVAKKGFVILANSRDSRLNNFDGKWAVAACSSGDRDFPIRWKMAHVCHANAVFPFVASAVKAVLSPTQRKSFILHNGSDEQVLESLSKYCLPDHCVPTEMGGSLCVSAEDFIRERLAKEGVSADALIQDRLAKEGGESYSNSIYQERSQWNAHRDAELNASHSASAASMPIAAENISSAQESEKQANIGSNPNKTKRKKSQASKKKTERITGHPGCRGDPRMHRAVQAKTDDPNMTIVDALTAGGFVFPDLDAHRGKLGDAKDTEGVTLYQRRNQLLRRLRLAKGKTGEK